MEPPTAPGSYKWTTCHFRVPLIILAFYLGSGKVTHPILDRSIDNSNSNVLLVNEINWSRI